MTRAAALVLLAVLQGCAGPSSPPVPTRDCPALPTLPANPTLAQRGQHTEALVALYLRCAGVNQ
ncbi:MAG: hypothetical protein ACT6S0_23585 [Roseateles sp.]|uniref:hypothetical protein n=1 Tax=Roseateles sp. TaxID=1971397 RepID=UPI0040360197